VLAAPHVTGTRVGGVTVFSTSPPGARAIAADCRRLGVEACAGELTRGDARAFLSDCPVSARSLSRQLDEAAGFARFLGADRVTTRTEDGGYPYTCRIEPSLASWVAGIARALGRWP
jgi:hypothetical protein